MTLILAFCGALPAFSFAAGLNNIPIGDWKEEAFIKVLNWAGYSYPTSTRPFKRSEVARILLKMRQDPKCRDLFAGDSFFTSQVARLEKSLRREIQEIENRDNGRVDFRVHWVEQVAIRAQGLRHRGDEADFDLGDICPNCGEGALSLSHAAQVENNLSIYLRETARFIESEDEDRDDAELIVEEGYAKIQAYGVELEVGRDHVWWGPGYDGTLMVSDNAPGLPMVKLSSFAPFKLPWIFRYLGPVQAHLLISRLEKARAVPEPYLTLMRVSIYPMETFEIGVTRAFMTGGEGRRNPRVDEFAGVLAGNREHETTGASRELNYNQIAGMDIRINTDGLRSWTPILMLSGYSEMAMEGIYHDKTFKIGGEDYYYVPAIVSYIHGFHVDMGRVDLRLEYADTATDPHFYPGDLIYEHGVYQTGYRYKGKIIGHHIGGGAIQRYAEANVWALPNLRLKLFYSNLHREYVLHHIDTYHKVGAELEYFLASTAPLKLSYQFGELSQRAPDVSERHATTHKAFLNFSVDF